MRLTYGEETFFRMTAQLMTTYDKGYLYSSQKTQLNQLREYHGYDIKRRMLGYIQASLINKGLIERQCRNLRNPDGTYEPMTSLTFITRKGNKLLVNRIQELWRAANLVVKQMLRYERKRKPEPGEQPLSLEDSKEKARELLAHLAHA